MDRYEEALAKARAGKPLDEIFPQLKESEDERIRKNILALVKKHAVNHERCQMEAWLEKQKEQKPAECIEDSVKFKEGFKAGRESGLCDGQKYVLDNLDSYGLCESAEWSEEDEAVLDALIRRLEGEDIYVSPHLAAECLKSFRPQPHWKPSEEQMDSLMRTITWLVEKGNLKDSSTLADLRRNLQKLL